MQSNSLIGPEVYSLMQTEKPIASFRKTILGQLYVNVIDPFTGEPTGRVLRGDPNKNDEGCIVDVWSVREEMYIRRANLRHFEQGLLISYKRPQKPREKSPNEVSDAELEELINSRGYLKLQSALNKFTSVAPVYRLLELARENEKSEKIIRAIEARLAEIQQKDFKKLDTTDEE